MRRALFLRTEPLQSVYSAGWRVAQASGSRFWCSGAADGLFLDTLGEGALHFGRTKRTTIALEDGLLRQWKGRLEEVDILDRDKLSAWIEER